MKVNIALEYDSVDHAIVALSKLTAIGVAAAKAAVKVDKPAAAVDKPKRPVGRPAKEPAKTQPEPIQEPVVVVVQDTEQITVVEPAKEPAATATEEDCKAALKRVFDACGMTNAQTLLNEFGAKRFGDVKADRYADFLAAANQYVGQATRPAQAVA